MNVFSPLIIQVIHFSHKRSLNGLFKQTSRGWTRLVRPPGITAVAVLFSRSCCFTVSVRWALNESQTSKLWVFANPPGRARQTFSIQNFNPAFVHPSLQVIMYHYASGEVVFWHRFSLEDDHRFKFGSICKARQYDCETSLLMTSCFQKNGFGSNGIDSLGCWHVEPHWRLTWANQSFVCYSRFSSHAHHVIFQHGMQL